MRKVKIVYINTIILIFIYMIGKHKAFNQIEFDRSDPKSRAVVKAYLKSFGLHYKDNPNECGIDLVGINTGDTIEIEHRWLWKGSIWPYLTVHIPERKGKFLNIKNINYVVVNNDFTYIGICLYENLKKYIDKVIEVRNSAIKEGEYFYDIPVDCFEWINLKEKELTMDDFVTYERN